MRIVFDIDGTICSTVCDIDRYNEAVPFKEMINAINSLFDDGHYIIIFTARGMGSCNNIIEDAYKKCFEMTKEQLNQWGIKYHELIFGKPYGDIYIDDKAFRINDPSVDYKKLLNLINNNK